MSERQIGFRFGILGLCLVNRSYYVRLKKMYSPVNIQEEHKKVSLLI